MSFLLDTDVVSAHLRGHRQLLQKLSQHAGRLFASSVTVAELGTWLHRSGTPVRFLAGLRAFEDDLVVLDVDESVADSAGRIGANLRDRGIIVSLTDLLIAATAMVHDLTLVTGNERHFAAVEALRVENWLRE